MRTNGPSACASQPFRIMRHEVTNRQFAAFVRTTGYVTDVGKNGEAHVWGRRWRQARGLTWRTPHGKTDTIAQRMDHPVVQISARDAADLLPALRPASADRGRMGVCGTRHRWAAFSLGQPATHPNRDGRLANFGTVGCCAPDATDGYRRTAPVGRNIQPVHRPSGSWTWRAMSGSGPPILFRVGRARRRCAAAAGATIPIACGSAYRHWNPPNIGLNMVGFRCAANAK